MLHNDNQNDQLFRDRLRDHSSPVRADLWRRIHNGLGSHPAFRFPFRADLQSPVRYWPFLAAGTAAAATLAITITYFIHNPARRPHPITNSTATVTQPSPATAAPATVQPVNHYLTIPSVHPTLAPHPLRSPTLIAANSPQLNTTRRETSLDPNSAANPGSTPASHHPNPVTLPAIARTSTRGPIPARHLMLKSRHNDPNNSNATPDARRSIKTGYISAYGSIDFPANHYYTWSYTIGGTVTIPFSRHWSGTAGLEYGRVNVPTQVVPPVGPFDTLHAFYFSNFEVPVLIGYTMMLGKYALTINAGAILNLYFHRYAKGNLPLSSTAYWVFNWPDRDSYGAYVGTDIFRPLGRSIRLFAQPYARYSISNYRMFIPVQRFSYGVLLGVRYQL